MKYCDKKELVTKIQAEINKQYTKEDENGSPPELVAYCNGLRHALQIVENDVPLLDGWTIFKLEIIDLCRKADANNGDS